METSKPYSETKINELRKEYCKEKEAKELDTTSNPNNSANTLRYNIKKPNLLTLPNIKVIFNSYNTNALACCIRLGILPDNKIYLEPIVKLLKQFSILVQNYSSDKEKTYFASSGMTLSQHKNKCTYKDERIIDNINKAGIYNSNALTSIAYILLTGDTDLLNDMLISDCQTDFDSISKFLDSEVDASQIPALIESYDSIKELYEHTLVSFEEEVTGRLNDTQKNIQFLQHEINSLKSEFNNKIIHLLEESNIINSIHEYDEQLSDFKFNLTNLLTQLTYTSKSCDTENWSEQFNSMIETISTDLENINNKLVAFDTTLQSTKKLPTTTVEASVNALLQTVKTLVAENLEYKEALKKINKTQQLLKKEG